jgi:hypothetical protein
MFVSPQAGKKVYDPCYIWDMDYSTAAMSDHKNVSRACTQWQFNTIKFGETITGKVNILICTRRKKGQVIFLIRPIASLRVLNGFRGFRFLLI